MNITTQTDPEVVESILIDGQPGKKFYFEFTQTDFRVRREDTILGRGKWTEVTSFEVDQIGQSFMRLRVLNGQTRLISVNIPLPEHSFGTSRVLEIFDHKIPAAKERKFRLLKPGLPFQITPITCQFAIWLGIACAIAPIFAAAGLYALNSVQPFADFLENCNFCFDLLFLSVPFGTLLSGAGAVAHRVLTRQKKETEHSEPIIFSIQSKFHRSKMAFFGQLLAEGSVVGIGAAYLVIMLSFTTPFRIPFTGFLIGAPIIMVLFMVVRFLSRSQESVTMTEGRIIVHRGSKTLANCYIADCSLHHHPKKENTLQLKFDGKVVEVHNHKVAGESLYEVFQSVKSGAKFIPILSEDHPGFRIRFNDEQPPGV